MIEKHYGDITLNSKLHQQLEQTIARYSIPKDTTRIALNCRNTSYYKTKEGVAPVEIQLKRENSRSDWNLVFVANFIYQDKATDSLDFFTECISVGINSIKPLANVVQAVLIIIIFM